MFTFHPERRLGLAVHSILAAGMVGLGGLSLLRATRTHIGPEFLMFLLPPLLAVWIVPALIYRFFALHSSAYGLERDGIHLRWGLRSEDIPMTSVLWVRTDREQNRSLPLPWLRLPGAVLGSRSLPGYGEIEFLADRSQGLVLIATPGRVFAISPADAEEFLMAFQRLTELGSLTPLQPRSVYPTFLLTRAWATRPARALLLGGLVLSLALLVWVSLAIPGRNQVGLGFGPDGLPRSPVPAVQLLLLPVLNTLIVLTDLFLGLFFFRRDEGHPLAYLMWSGVLAIPFLFLVAVFFILRSG